MAFKSKGDIKGLYVLKFQCLMYIISQSNSNGLLKNNKR